MVEAVNLVTIPDFIFIYNKETLKGTEILLKKFEGMYKDAFPDINEQEKFETIINRVANTQKGPEPNTFIILATILVNKKAVLAGGMICDWYNNSKAIHLTYIVVDESAREHKIGKNLINVGIKEIKDIILREYNVKLKTIFFESNNPRETSIDNDSIDPFTRLKIFSSLNAKWIDIPYIQPSLDSEKKRVDNLYLFTFPEPNEDNGHLKADEIKEFLSDLYIGLGNSNLEKDSDFQKMCISLYKEKNGFFQLKSVPVENDMFRFYTASVVLHFVEIIDPNSETESNKLKPDFCKYFNSYEKDLLNFRNQANLPFSTCTHPEWMNKQITIKFCNDYKYTTEGREENKYLKNNEINARCSLSCTSFFEAGIKVWHLVISPVPGGFFTEFDLIKLINFYGSRQESTDLYDDYRIIYNEEELTNFRFLPDKIVNEIITKNLHPAGTGIVQFDVSDLKFRSDDYKIKWSDIFSNLKNIKEKGELLIDDNQINKKENSVHCMKVLCGLILGIFDFDRMGIEEITDTLNPLAASDKYYSVINRGNILCLGEKEEMMNSVYHTIGISPYLLIPSAVITYNYFILSEADKVLNECLEQNKAIADKSEAWKFKMVVERIPGVVNNLQLKGVFQYPTEREIFNAGTIQRGIDLLDANIRLRLDDLKNKIEAWDRKKAAISIGINSVILIFIPAVTLYGIIKDLLELTDTLKQNIPLLVGVSAIISIALGVIISIITYRATISQKRHEK